MLKDAEKHILLQSKIPLTDVLLLVFSASEYSTQYKFTVSLPENYSTVP